MKWPFQNKSNEENILLTAMFEGEVITEIPNKNLPIEILKSLPINSQMPKLALIDNKQKRYIYDLSSVLIEGFKWIHFSIRVSQGFIAQVDCLLNSSPDVTEKEFKAGEGKGIRFQPIFLAGFKGNPNDFIGRSCIGRGFHYPAFVTPGNVSLLSICDVCQKSFRVQSFHAGFNDSHHFYCSQGPHVLVLSNYLKGVPMPLGKATKEMLKKYEESLPKCRTCEGEFRYMNAFLCPHCKAPYIDFQKHPKDHEDYYGNYLYGEKPQVFKPEK